MRSPRVFRLIALMTTVVGGRAEETPMSDDTTLAGPPTFTLASPGVGTTEDPEALESGMGTYWIHLGPGRRLYTVEWYPGGHSEAPPIQPQDAVEWETVVPWGAQVFSVTAGVSAARVRQFWVGWLSGGQVFMEALDGIRTLTSWLEADESVVFPAVMDGSGVASVYSWRPTASGAALWQHVFSKWSAGAPRKLMDIPGRPALSRVTSVPGLRTQHAVVGWVEQTDASTSVLGTALVEEGRATFHRSHPIPGTRVLSPQRMGVWASAPDTWETAAILTSAGPQAHEVARFGVNTETPEGAVKIDVLNLGPGQVARAAIDYCRYAEEPRFNRALLMADGRLIGRYGDVVRTSVPLNSELPIVTVGRSAYWRVRKPDGTFDLEPL
jgi:hypothetical protein